MPLNENLIKVYEYALNQEQTGKSFFEASLQRLSVGAAVNAFHMLIEEEQKHIHFISAILEDLKTGGEVNAGVIESITLQPTNYFDDRSKSEFLQRCVEGSMVPDVTVFNTAWLIEKDLSEFYANAAAHTEGNVKKTFEMLSRWEHGHEAFFKSFRDKLSETYANMPWGG